MSPPFVIEAQILRVMPSPASSLDRAILQRLAGLDRVHDISPTERRPRRLLGTGNSFRVNDALIASTTGIDEFIKLLPKMTKRFDIIWRQVREHVQNDAPMILDVHLSFRGMGKVQYYDLVQGIPRCFPLNI
jgi:hypothetical protein